ncbi:GNAT family N-acetyltransferase [Enterococcus sp. BWB1-3]|uniref:GNAT family N-acetyltransferase n=1 Tax=Enterococcus sp. BWB1-3 TaxID=2787713 RepID=UPI001922E863
MPDIQLMKISENDFSDYYRLVSDEKVMAQITERAIPKTEAMENFQKVLSRNSRLVNLGSFKVVHSETKDFLGWVHVTCEEGNTEKAEIGYMFLPQYWGQGYGREAVKQLLALVEASPLKELTAMIAPDNHASRKLLTNNGFQSVFLGMMDGLNTEILDKIIK